MFEPHAPPPANLRHRPARSPRAPLPAPGRSVSRRSISRSAQAGTLLMAPGPIRKTPVVPTASGLGLPLRGPFHGQGDLRPGQQGVVAVGHQDGPGVPALAGQPQAQRRRERRSSRPRRSPAPRAPGSAPARCAVRRRPRSAPAPAAPRPSRPCSPVAGRATPPGSLPSRSDQGVGGRRVQRAAQQAAAQAAQAETRRLLGGES